MEVNCLLLIQIHRFATRWGNVMQTLIGDVYRSNRMYHRQLPANAFPAASCISFSNYLYSGAWIICIQNATHRSTSVPVLCWEYASWRAESVRTVSMISMIYMTLPPPQLTYHLHTLCHFEAYPWKLLRLNISTHSSVNQFKRPTICDKRF